MPRWQGIIDGTNKGSILAELELTSGTVRGVAAVNEISGFTYSFTIEGTYDGGSASATLRDFKPPHEGIPQHGQLEGTFGQDGHEFIGTWNTNIGTQGTVHLYRMSADATPGQLAQRAPDPLSLVSKTISLPACRLDVQGLGGLIQIILRGTLVQTPIFTIVDAGRSLIKAGIQALVDDKALPPIVNEMTINANESWENRGSTNVVVSLKKHESNTVFVSGVDEAWVTGKCEQIRSYLAAYQSRLVSWYRQYGQWLNSILFLVMLALLPSIETFQQRFTFSLIVVLLLLVLFWSHQRAIPNCTIILKTKPPSFWDRYRDPIVGFLLTAVGTAVVGILGYLFKKGW